MGCVFKVRSHTDPRDGREDNIPYHPISFRSIKKLVDLDYLSLQLLLYRSRYEIIVTGKF